MQHTQDQMRFGSARAIAHEAASLIVTAGRNAVATRGRFSFALSPAFVTPPLLDALAATAEAERAIWAATHVFLADTVFTSARYPGAALAGALMANLPLDERQIHFGPVRMRDAVRAAVAYEYELRAFFRLAAGAVPRFDLVVVLLDPAGRIGGLGVHGGGMDQVTRLVVAEFATDRCAQAVTLTGTALAAAAQILVRTTHSGAARQVTELRERRGHALAWMRENVQFLIEVEDTRAPALAVALEKTNAQRLQALGRRGCGRSYRES
jgi:6-phosphogluconolactonase/glucosamine-6-phosphate isomerase/deaminase